MRLLLCGGGTAGHVNPAIAIAEELTKQDPQSKILFIGRKGGRENELIAKAGFEVKTIDIQGLIRSISAENIKRIKKAFSAITEAEKIIKAFCPDVILGTGGYVCWPVITAGHRLGIPTAIHESNISPGLTTRLLAKKCSTIFINHKQTEKYFREKRKVKTVGNPLRADFFSKTTRSEARKKLNLTDKDFLIISFGGSIGADKLNEVVIDVMEKYSSKEEDIKHIHATGKRYFDKIKTRSKQYSNCTILPFIENMPMLLKASDAVICRCGAITLSEVAEAGAASILIPSPNVSGNHQYKNAKHLKSIDAATLIEEKNLTSDLLINTLIWLKNDKNGRKKRAKNIKAISTPHSAKLIVTQLFSLKNHTKKAIC